MKLPSQLVELTQGSARWHEWRKSGIGASEVAAILWKDKYKTPYKLWEEKSGYAPVTAENAAMRHGRESEEFVRRKVENATGVSFDPCCYEQTDGPLRASLDGLAGSVILEIKCPYSKEILASTRSGEYPEHWHCQIQTQLMLSPATHALLAVWDFERAQVSLDEIVVDEDLQSMIAEEAPLFWRMVATGVPPETASHEVPLTLSDKLESLFEKYGELDENIKSLIKLKESIKEEIKHEAGNRPVKTLGWHFSFAKKMHKTYDWDKMKSDGVDVSPYEIRRESLVPVIKKRRKPCSQQ